MTSQQQLVCDSSTAANFKAWASAISNFCRTAGWTNTSDTGQLNGAGGNNWAGVSTVPGSGAFYYEIFQPGDALTTFYLKLEYGNYISQTNCPTLRVTIGTGTNGAGTLTGFVVGPFLTTGQNFTAPSTTTQYECDFSGDSGRLHFMLWRNGTNNCQQLVSIERSLNSSGAYTSTHVTLIALGNIGSINGNPNVNQQTLVFGVGVAPAQSVAGTATPFGGLSVRLFDAGQTTGSSAFNGIIPFDLVAPAVGFFDYPLTGVGVAYQPDLVEGVTFVATVYGSTRTYMPSKNGGFAGAGPYSRPVALCMRYD